MTDERAGRLFLNALPPEWVVNSFPRDYGKDYHVELVGHGGRVGRAFYVQLKGAGACKRVGGDHVSYPLERRHVAYFLQEVALPLFLVVADVGRGECFWLFVQRHLLERLGTGPCRGLSVRIPAANRLHDISSFEVAVSEALDWMALFRAGPLRDRAARYVRSLASLDPRFRVEATFTESEERVSLTPLVPVRVGLGLSPIGGPRAVRAKVNSFARGEPVAVTPGEFRIEGSALLCEIAEGAGVVQVRVHSEAQLTLRFQGNCTFRDLMHSSG